MAKDNYYVVMFIAIIAAFLIGIVCGQHRDDVIEKENYEYKHTLDSISDKIREKDSIIVRLEERMHYDVEKVYMLDDSTSIKLFEMLVYGRKRYCPSTGN